MQNNEESEQNIASKMRIFLLSHQDAHPSGILFCSFMFG